MLRLCANNWASLVPLLGAPIATCPCLGIPFGMLSAPPRRSVMSYRIAAIDVHKRMLAVVVTDVEGAGEYQFERRKFGTTPGELHVLAQWLVELEVEEVVMESTAVLEAGVGHAGVVLETGAAAA